MIMILIQEYGLTPQFKMKISLVITFENLSNSAIK